MRGYRAEYFSHSRLASDLISGVTRCSQAGTRRCRVEVRQEQTLDQLFRGRRNRPAAV